MNQQITLKIILQNPPAGVDFGIQKGRGSKYETIMKQRSGNKNLEFEFAVGVNPGKDLLHDFFGPYVQGAASERFIYIDIGTYAGQADSVWSRRLKVPIRGITQEMIRNLSAEPNSILVTKVPGTGKDFGSNCGTVKPFDGWYLAKSP